ncbi:MAG: hypothetical protein ACUZ8O_15835 [Candidatus Anammoxibacter sp.]
MIIEKNGNVISTGMLCNGFNYFLTGKTGYTRLKNQNHSKNHYNDIESVELIVKFDLKVRSKTI